MGKASRLLYNEANSIAIPRHDTCESLRRYETAVIRMFVYEEGGKMYV